MKTNFKFLLFVILMGIHNISMAKEKCESLKGDFTKLYIALQDSLNYEGKDATTQGKGVRLQAHSSLKNGKYEGKLFQDMLYKQYQNSLKKVAALLLKIGKNQNTAVEYNQDSIIEFFKSIDSTSYNNADVNSLLNKIAEKGKEVFKDPADQMKILNENDKYLLSKLLIHSKDKICSVEKNSGKTKKSQALTELQQYPLNRMVYALKNANLKGNETVNDIQRSEDITGDKIKTSSAKVENGKVVDVVDAEKTIQSAVLDNLHALESWLKAHESCRNYFATTKGIFIQSGIQGCNYNKFINSLNNSTSDFEKILHFINANQKSKLKAETNLDPSLLENYIDSAIKASNVPSCDKIGDAYFVRNLKYNGKLFDPKENNFECTTNGTKADCNKSIKLVSDDLGRGIKVVPNVKNVKFKIPNSNCSEEMSLSDSDGNGRIGGNDGGSNGNNRNHPDGSNPNGLTDNNSDDDKLTPEQREFKQSCEKNNGKIKNGQCVIGNEKLNPEQLKFRNDCTDNKGTVKGDQCIIGNEKLSREQLKQKADCEKDNGSFKNGKCEKTELALTPEQQKQKEACEKDKGTYKNGKCEKAEVPLTPEQQKQKEACEKDKGTYKNGKCEKAEAPLTPEQQKEKEACEKDKGTYKDGKCEKTEPPLTPEQQKEKENCEKDKGIYKDGKCEKYDSIAEQKKACEDMGNVFLSDGSGEFSSGNCVKKRDKDQSGKSSGGSDSDSPADPFKDFLNGIGAQGGSKGSQRFVPQQIPTKPTYVTPGLQ